MVGHSLMLVAPCFALLVAVLFGQRLHLGPREPGLDRPPDMVPFIVVVDSPLQLSTDSLEMHNFDGSG